MNKSKIFSYEYDEYEDGTKGAHTLIDDLFADPDFSGLTELSIGNWGDCWEESCQPIIDGIISHAKEFSHIRSLFIGDMDFEECEVSWIIQGNYGGLWAALPELTELTIKGSTDLELGAVSHEKLESLTIICGGLPNSVIESVKNARLPGLKKLILYIGSDSYGFEGDCETIRSLLDTMDFPNLEYLGIVDSEMQDEMTETVLGCRYMDQIHTLDLSCGTLSDKGGALLLEALPAHPNIQKLDAHYHYLSTGMMQRLAALPIETELSEQNKPDNYRGEVWMNAMLTE